MNDPEPTAPAPGDAAGRPDELARLAAAVRAIERNETPPPGRSPARTTGAAASGGPASGGPASGDSASGGPASGDSASGGPASGDSASGGPASGAGVPGARGASGGASTGGPHAGGDAASGQPPAGAGLTPQELPGEPVEAARTVLARGGAPESLAAPAVGVLGERAGALLLADPWAVLGLPGVRPDQADGFARTLLGAAGRPDDPRRGHAVTGWLLARAADAGHTALEWSVLAAALAKQAVPDPEELLRGAVEDGSVMVFRDERAPEPGARAGRPADADGEEDDAPVDILLALDRYALAEESLADGLMAVLNSTPSDGVSAESGEPVTVDWEAAAAAAPSPSAAALVRAVADSSLVTHTGGEAARAEPAALVAAARAAGLRAYAAAHTEDGRRRLAAVLDPDAAVTVAGLLSGAQGPGRAADGALALDLLAVLDAPQLDVEGAATLVEAVPDGARLVLSGDPGVLWSAGPGRVFADLLAARVCPHAVSRTPDPGPIGELVSGVGVGELAPVEAPEKEVVVVPVRDPREAVHRAVQLVADSIPRAIGVPAADTVAVTLAHGGPVGTRALNAALKERLNPGPGRFAGFDPGDRVVHSPAPGAPPAFGTVVSADPAGLRVDCAGTPVVVPPDSVPDTLRHAWAVTAHQAAGTRWPAVVVVVPGEAPPAQPLTRAWVSTAFSRADRHLSVVQGDAHTLTAAVADRPAKPRTTRLRAILREHAPQP